MNSEKKKNWNLSTAEHRGWNNQVIGIFISDGDYYSKNLIYIKKFLKNINYSNIPPSLQFNMVYVVLTN